MTPGPWEIVDGTTEKHGYIAIRGPNGEKICDIFPFAGFDGVGVETARQNAAAIVSLVNARE